METTEKMIANVGSEDVDDWDGEEVIHNLRHLKWQEPGGRQSPDRNDKGAQNIISPKLKICNHDNNIKKNTKGY